MKLKLDENLGRRTSDLFRQHGHDVSTVQEQGVCSVTDRMLMDIWRRKHRCLVTLDLDFGNPLLFNLLLFNLLSMRGLSCFDCRLNPTPEI